MGLVLAWLWPRLNPSSSGCIAKMLIRRNSHKIRKHFAAAVAVAGGRRQAAGGEEEEQGQSAAAIGSWLRMPSPAPEMTLALAFDLRGCRRLSAAHQQQRQQSSAHPSSTTTATTPVVESCAGFPPLSHCPLPWHLCCLPACLRRAA